MSNRDLDKPQKISRRASHKQLIANELSEEICLHDLAIEECDECYELLELSL